MAGLLTVKHCPVSERLTRRLEAEAGFAVPLTPGAERRGVQDSNHYEQIREAIQAHQMVTTIPDQESGKGQQRL